MRVRSHRLRRRTERIDIRIFHASSRVHHAHGFSSSTPFVAKRRFGDQRGSSRRARHRRRHHRSSENVSRRRARVSVCVSGSAQKVFRKKCSLLARLIDYLLRAQPKELCVCTREKRFKNFLLVVERRDRSIFPRSSRKIDRPIETVREKKTKKNLAEDTPPPRQHRAAAEFVITRHQRKRISSSSSHFCKRAHASLTSPHFIHIIDTALRITLISSQ